MLALESKTRCAAMLIAWSVVLAGPRAAVAVVPTTMTYSGTLADDGAPFTGEVAMTFSIYDAATFGTQVWSESFASVAVAAGAFTVHLGSVRPLDASVFDGRVLYLELQVNDERLTPRITLSSVPYATRADDSETLQGLTPADLATSADLATADRAAVHWENLTDVPVPGLSCDTRERLTWDGIRFLCAPPATVAWSELTGVPAGFADGLDNSVSVSEAEVDALVANNGYLTSEAQVDALVANNGYLTSEADPSVNAIGKMALVSCALNQVPKLTSTGWRCENDASLTEAQVDTFVANNGYLSAGDAVANQTSAAQTANYWITGDGIVESRLRVRGAAKYSRRPLAGYTFVEQAQWSNGITVGNRFLCNASGASVTQLGYFNAAGRNANVTVKLWSDTGTLLASGNVVNAPANAWVYVNVTPVALTQGQYYRLGAYQAGATSYQSVSAAGTTGDGNIVFTGTAYMNSGDGFPSSTAFSGTYFNAFDLGYVSPPSAASAPLAGYTFAEEAQWSNGITVGNRFLCNASGASVTQLGYFNAGGRNANVTVKLWSDSGTLLASGNVVNAPANAWVYVNVTPVALTQGQYYRLGAYQSGATSYQSVSLAGTTGDGNIVFTGTAYMNSGDGFPSSTAFSGTYFNAFDLRYSLTNGFGGDAQTAFAVDNGGNVFVGGDLHLLGRLTMPAQPASAMPPIGVVVGFDDSSCSTGCPAGWTLLGAPAYAQAGGCPRLCYSAEYSLVAIKADSSCNLDCPAGWTDAGRPMNPPSGCPHVCVK